MKKLILIMLVLVGCGQEETDYRYRATRCFDDSTISDALEFITKEYRMKEKAALYKMSVDQYVHNQKILNKGTFETCELIMKEIKSRGETLKKETWDLCAKYENSLYKETINVYNCKLVKE